MIKMRVWLVTAKGWKSGKLTNSERCNNVSLEISRVFRSSPEKCLQQTKSTH
uniref:MIP08561p n=1 Tax=Drosophila melanogaster TaxID=7227 RepID=C0PVA3_DROME|nr:MIP08561p [Drosophila melanogaster]